jgi:hypothetical protein
MTDETEKLNDLQNQYEANLHAMQSGVAMVLELDRKDRKENGETSVKHLRTGVNSALMDAAALAELLIAKGIFTKIEYYEALVTVTARDVESYRRVIADRMNVPVDTIGLA